MIRKEIKHFTLKVSEYNNIPVGTPCSVLSALFAQGLIGDPYYGTNAALHDLTSGGAEFSAEFEIDPVMLAMDNLILSVGGLDAPAVVIVNGIPVAGIENSFLPYEFDMKGRVSVGKNNLTLRLAPRKRREGEYLTDLSIHAPIELVAYNRAIIDEVILTESYADDKMHIGIKMTTKGYNIRQRAVAVLTSPSGSISYATLTGGEGEITVTNPNLWRPGRSHPHRLYRLAVNLYSDTELIDSKEYKIGMRTLELSSEGRLSLWGKPYYPIALRYTSADLIKPRATAQRIDLLLGRIADSGIDMLLVESDDVYPSEQFLRSCDELGIALAIRMILPERYKSAVGRSIMRSDISRVMRVFASHPSVFAIYGAGEFKGDVCEEMKRTLPGVLYLDEPLRTASAVPSLPTRYTAKTYFDADDMNLTSPALTDRGGDPLSLLSRVVGEYRIPHSLGEWTYLSGVASAELAVSEAYRAILAQSGTGVCLAAASEPIPAFTPSMLDYSERPKAMYYYMQRTIAPAMVFGEADGTKISFKAINTESIVYKFRLSYSIISNDNRIIARDSVALSIDPHSSATVYEYDAGELVRGHESEYFLSYSVTDSAGTRAHNALLFTPTLAFSFKKPSCTVEVSGSGCEYTVTVYSDVYMRAVELWLDGDEDAVLEDNFFDITSDVPMRVKLITARPTALETVKRHMRLRSMYDVGRSDSEE